MGEDKYLLDTDTFSYLVDGRRPEVRERVIANQNAISISVITNGECKMRNCGTHTLSWQFFIFNFQFFIRQARATPESKTAKPCNLVNPSAAQSATLGRWVPRKSAALGEKRLWRSFGAIEQTYFSQCGAHGRSVVATTLFAENCVCEASVFKKGVGGGGRCVAATFFHNLS